MGHPTRKTTLRITGEYKSPDSIGCRDWYLRSDLRVSGPSETLRFAGLPTGQDKDSAGLGHRTSVSYQERVSRLATNGRRKRCLLNFGCRGLSRVGETEP